LEQLHILFNVKGHYSSPKLRKQLRLHAANVPVKVE